MKCIWNLWSHKNTDVDINPYMPIYIGRQEQYQEVLCQHHNAMC